MARFQAAIAKGCFSIQIKSNNKKKFLWPWLLKKKPYKKITLWNSTHNRVNPLVFIVFCCSGNAVTNNHHHTCVFFIVIRRKKTVKIFSGRWLHSQDWQLWGIIFQVYPRHHEHKHPHYRTEWCTPCARNFLMVQSSIVYWISQNLMSSCWQSSSA